MSQPVDVNVPFLFAFNSSSSSYFVLNSRRVDILTPMEEAYVTFFAPSPGDLHKILISAIQVVDTIFFPRNDCKNENTQSGVFNRRNRQY